MLEKIRNWRKRQPVKTQLLISLVLAWLFWFCIATLGDFTFFGKESSVESHIFHASFMSILMTVLSNLAKLKALVKKKQDPFI